MAQFNWVSAPPDSVLLDGIPLGVFPFDTINTVSLQGWCFDLLSQKCLVRFPDNKSGHQLDAYFPPTSSAQNQHGIDLPHQYSLRQNYPNPFNPITVISYEIPVSSLVDLIVFDLLGREVAVLVNEEIPAGIHTIQWNAGHMPSGVYFYRLTAGTYTQTRQMILIK